jgi:hypothetical protein
MTLCTARAALNADQVQVTRYACEVANLPSWSGFFTSVGNAVDGRYAVESKAGPIQTWIEQEAIVGGARLTICSVIHGRSERAVLEVVEEPTGGSVAVLRVDLLGDPPEESVGVQRHRMLAELAALDRATSGRAQSQPR